MLKNSLYIFLLLFSFSQSCFPQTSCQFELIVVDSHSNIALPNVHLSVHHSNRVLISSSQGKFDLSCLDLPLQLSLTHVGYKTKDLTISSPGIYEVTLEMESLLLNEFCFNAIKTVVNDENIYILDYEFYENNLVVLGYYERYNRSSLFLIDDSGDTLSETKLSGKASRLQKNCDNQLQLVISDDVFSLDYLKNQFRINYLYSNRSEGIALSCNCNYEDGYLAGFYVTNQLFSYVSINQDSILSYFRILDNRDYLNQAENWGVSNSDNKAYNFDYLNKLEGRKLARSKYMTIIEEAGMYKNEDDFYAGLNMNPNYDNRYLLNLHYYNHVINKAVSVPIFTIYDKIYLFNHVDGWIEIYSQKLELLSKVKIDYFEKRNWKRQLYLDDISSKVFTVFEKSGITSICEIDLKTGELISDYKIPKAFVSNIKVHDGSVYFLYKENDYLSSEREVVKLYSINF